MTGTLTNERVIPGEPDCPKCQRDVPPNRPTALGPVVAGLKVGTIGRGAIFAVLLVVMGCGKSPTEPTPPATTNSSDAPPVTNSVTDADLAFCVSETNRYRANGGVPAVARSATIESHAATAARADTESGIAHNYSNATAPPPWGENEVLRQPLSADGGTPHNVIQQAIARFWSEGPNGPHRQNLLGPYTQVGCGFYFSGELVTFVQHFRR
jgi:uncharacterized protein YkwD